MEHIEQYQRTFSTMFIMASMQRARRGRRREEQCHEQRRHGAGSRRRPSMIDKWLSSFVVVAGAARTAAHVRTITPIKYVLHTQCCNTTDSFRVIRHARITTSVEQQIKVPLK